MFGFGCFDVVEFGVFGLLVLLFCIFGVFVCVLGYCASVCYRLCL